MYDKVLYIIVFLIFITIILIWSFSIRRKNTISQTKIDKVGYGTRCNSDQLCDDDLFCDNICYKDIGAKCDSTYECRKGAICVDVCGYQASGGLNQICNLDQGCDPSLECLFDGDSNQGRCKIKDFFGQCIINSHCKSGYCSNGICQPVVDNGLPCLTNSNCIEGNCDQSTGYCQPVGIKSGEIGSGCSYFGSQCNQGLYCTFDISNPNLTGTCAIPISQWPQDSCDSSRACIPPSLCVNNKCVLIQPNLCRLGSCIEGYTCIDQVCIANPNSPSINGRYSFVEYQWPERNSASIGRWNYINQFQYPYRDNISLTVIDYSLGSLYFSGFTGTSFTGQNRNYRAGSIYNQFVISLFLNYVFYDGNTPVENVNTLYVANYSYIKLDISQKLAISIKLNKPSDNANYYERIYIYTFGDELYKNQNIYITIPHQLGPNGLPTFYNFRYGSNLITSDLRREQLFIDQTAIDLDNINLYDRNFRELFTLDGNIGVYPLLTSRFRVDSSRNNIVIDTNRIRFYQNSLLVATIPANIDRITTYYSIPTNPNQVKFLYIDGNDLRYIDGINPSDNILLAGYFNSTGQVTQFCLSYRNDNINSEYYLEEYGWKSKIVLLTNVV